MERIWSPWRMEYIQAAKRADGRRRLHLLRPAASGDDAKALILARAELAFVLVNSFPYNPGHLMVAPFRHAGEFEHALAGGARGASTG